MARITGNTLRTVRFYEEAGILHPDRRSAGGHRLFGQAQLERLQFITDMRAANLSLDEIRAMLDIKDKAETGAQAAESAVGALDRQIDTVRDKIIVFERLLKDLQNARELVEHCRQCTHDKSFPESCQDCDVMRKGPVPQSMKVLWGLKEKGAAQAEHAEEG